MKSMYQTIKNLLFHTLVPAVLAVLIFPTLAFAQTQSQSVSIPVEIQVTGRGIPAGVPYKLVIEGVTPGAPMPEETIVTIMDGGKASFGPIEYTIPGDYQYRIYQNSDAKKFFTYDQKSYAVTVRIVNDQNGNLSSEIWAVDSSSSEGKADKIIFVNHYARSGGGGGDGGGGSDGGDPGRPGTNTGGDGLTVITEEAPPLAALFPDSIIPDNLVPLAMLPKTGDTTNLALWIILMVLSGSGMLLLARFKKRITSSSSDDFPSHPKGE